MTQKSKGGPRPGAGRKPTANPKRPITVYIEERMIEKWGGDEELKKKIQDFVNFPSFGTPEIVTTNAEGVLVVREATAEEIGEPVMVTLTPQSYQPVPEQPKAHADKGALLKQIEAIKAEKCPEHRSKTKLGRDSWEMDKNKRIEELQQQLNNL